MGEKHFLRRVAIWLPLLFTIPLGIYLWLSVYTRYIADDWCLSLKIRQTGSVLQVLVNDYFNWFGRYTASITTNLFASAGLPRIQLWVPAVILSWYAGFAWMMAEIASAFHFRWHWRFGLLVALVIVPATLAGTPSLVQSIYWPNGLWVYVTSVLVLPYMAALILRAARLNWRGWKLACAALIVIIMAAYAAGYTEPHTAVQLGMLVFALLGMWITKTRSRSASILLIVALITTIIASVIIIFAPGNAVRGSNFQQQPIVEAVMNSIIHAVAIVAASTLGFSPWAAIAALVIPLLITRFVVGDVPYTRRQLQSALLILLVLTVVLFVGFMLPGFVATSRPPPARSLIIPEFLWLTTLAFLGIGLAMLEKRQSRSPSRLNTAILTALGVVSLVGITIQAAIYIQPLTIHASEWDNRDRIIRVAKEQGETNIVIAPLSVDTAERTGLALLSNDPDFWMNRCAAEYYGVESITVEESD